MKDYEVLVSSLFMDLVDSSDLSLDDIREIVTDSYIDEFCKKSMLSIVDSSSKSSECIRKLLDHKINDNKKRIAVFEKVSEEQFVKDLRYFRKEEALKRYEEVKIPTRATRGSAGYDFVSPIDVRLKPGESVVVCLGVRCCMAENWVLKLYPRSGLGTKFKLQLMNTVGVIDSDYYYSDNEGHIMVKITNDNNEGKIFEINRGERLCQGVFVEYGITLDDDVSDVRNGGFGSSGK